MIDPEQIQPQEHNLANIITLSANEVPECDIQCWCLDDDKEYEKFVKAVESTVRRSFEYKEFIKYCQRMKWNSRNLLNTNIIF